MLGRGNLVRSARLHPSKIKTEKITLSWVEGGGGCHLPSVCVWGVTPSQVGCENIPERVQCRGCWHWGVVYHVCRATDTFQWSTVLLFENLESSLLINCQHHPVGLITTTHLVVIIILQVPHSLGVFFTVFNF